MKKKLETLYLLAITIIVIAIFILGGIYLFKDKYSLDYINSDQEVAKNTKFADNVIVFFVDYDGKLPPQTIYKSMFDTFTNVIPKLYKDLKNADDTEIMKYMEKNQKYIKEKLGIEDKEAFYKLAYAIKGLQGDRLEYGASEVKTDTIQHYKNYSNMVVNLQYQNNHILQLNLHVRRYISKDASPIIYTVVTEE